MFKSIDSFLATFVPFSGFAASAILLTASFVR